MSKRNMSPDTHFGLFISTELFLNKHIQIELVIFALKNCLTRGLLLRTATDFPSLYSLFNQEVAPYLPLYDHKEFTLVLDLDETLGHFDGKTFLVRPGAEDFLNQMSKHYELVLFTAGSEKYANLAMKIIDPNGLISLRLYRQHTIDAKVKDLFTLGRDIDKTIIIDNAKISFEKQPDNGIVVES